jgi:hypothetical protein
MSASSNTNGKQKAGGSKPVIKTYTGPAKHLEVAFKEQSRKGGNVTSRMGDYTDASKQHRKYTLRGKPADCDSFNDGVIEIYERLKAGKKGGKRSETPKPKHQHGGRKEMGARSGSPYPKHKERRDRSDSPPPRHKERGARSGSPYPKHKERGARSGSPYPRHKERGARSGSPYPRHKERGARSGSPPPRHKERRDRSDSPPPRHKERGALSGSPPRPRQTAINPYMPPRGVVNSYMPQRTAEDFRLGALGGNLGSVTVTTTTVSYSFGSKPKHTNPHTPGTDAWIRYFIDWNGGEC